MITIDPARRLADTLGLAGTNDHEVARDLWDPEGRAPDTGRLTALMLDTSETFDGLVGRYAESEEQRDRILENRFYRNLAGALSGPGFSCDGIAVEPITADTRRQVICPARQHGRRRGRFV